MSKNILILQHIDIETPGYILDLMQRDKFNLTTIELDEGEKIPNNLDQFDGMFCMGGPMDTWMEKNYSWLFKFDIIIIVIKGMVIAKIVSALFATLLTFSS